MATCNETGSECLSYYTMCDEHGNGELHQFCKTHNVLLCTACVFSNHSSCENVLITDKIKEANQKECFDTFKKNVQALQIKLIGLETLKENKRRTQLKSIQKCYDTVRQTREVINKHLDKIERDLIIRIQMQERKLSSEAEKILTDCKHYIEKIEKVMQTLNGCRKIDDDAILFIARQKCEPIFKSLNQAYTAIQATVQPDLNIYVVIDEKISELSSELREMGRVLHRQVLDTPIKADQEYFSGCVFLPDGRLVVCSYNSGTVLFYGVNGIRLSVLQLQSRIKKIAVLAEDMLVGTVPGLLEIHFVQVNGNNLEVVKKIKTKRPCYGIDVFNGKLFTTCYASESKVAGEVIVLSLEGKPLKRYKKALKNACFRSPCDVCVDQLTSCIYVIDECDNQTVILLSQDGKLLEEINDSEFDAICRDSSRNRIITVCGRSLKTFSGSTLINKHYLHNYEAGVSAIAYRPSDNALLVCNFGGKPEIYWRNDSLESVAFLV